MKKTPSSSVPAQKFKFKHPTLSKPSSLFRPQPAPQSFLKIRTKNCQKSFTQASSKIPKTFVPSQSPLRGALTYTKDLVVEPPAEKVCCKICTGFLRRPVTCTRCKCLFCSECVIKYVPAGRCYSGCSKAVIRPIDLDQTFKNVLLRCCNYERGCPVKFKRDEDTHSKDCQFQIVKCQYCSKELLLKDVRIHRMGCTKEAKEARCQYCREKIGAQEKHILKCTYRLWNCKAFPHCLFIGKIAEIKQHQSRCSWLLRKCDDCGFSYRVSEKTQHKCTDSLRDSIDQCQKVFMDKAFACEKAEIENTDLKNSLIELNEMIRLKQKVIEGLKAQVEKHAVSKQITMGQQYLKIHENPSKSTPTPPALLDSSNPDTTAPTCPKPLSPSSCDITLSKLSPTPSLTLKIPKSPNLPRKRPIAPPSPSLYPLIPQIPPSPPPSPPQSPSYSSLLSSLTNSPTLDGALSKEGFEELLEEIVKKDHTVRVVLEQEECACAGKDFRRKRNVKADKKVAPPKIGRCIYCKNVLCKRCKGQCCTCKQSLCSNCQDQCMVCYQIHCSDCACMCNRN
ncbi:unnamed protein product [Moneuplotes crassus]|uniref:Uncharacterized protein n=1 Tax=Euplotes crassus TaxID=5936 RepID=A0AAD1UEG3_EUPCR|nr:unnamed protein product [Moneuplotes crassus]